MPTRTAFASDGPDPKKIAGLVFAGLTIYGLAKGKRTHPVAAAGALLTVITFLSGR